MILTIALAATIVAGGGNTLTSAPETRVARSDAVEMVWHVRSTDADIDQLAVRIAVTGCEAGHGTVAGIWGVESWSLTGTRVADSIARATCKESA